MEGTQAREVRAETGRSWPRSTEHGWDETRALSCLPVPADTPRGGDEWNSGDGGDRSGLRKARSLPPRLSDGGYPSPR